MSTKPAFLPSNLTPAATSPFAIPSDWKTAACMLAADAFALSLVFALTVLGWRVVTSAYQLGSCVELLPCLGIVLVAFWAQGLYPGVLRHPAEEMRRIYSSINIVFLGMASTTFLWRNAESYSRSRFLLAWAAAPPAVLLSRYILRRSLAAKPWWGVPAVVLGSGPMAQKVVRSLRDGMLGVRVTGVLASERMLAWPSDLPQATREVWSDSLESQSSPAQYAIVAMPERLAVELRHAIHYYCRGFSHVILVPDMPGLCSLGLSALEIGGAFGVELPQRLFHRGASAVKRIVDLLLGSLALLLVAPLLLLITLAIKLMSNGPIFYRHVRVGRNGESIEALKFRTMVVDAESVLEDYLAAHPECQLEWRRDRKLKIDPRVIPVGRWLRRFSLDELPQLWNVLSGQMSLVGPRPISESEIERYGRGYDLYTRVRPGITGLWQVSGRNNTTYEERVSFDEYYVRNWSVWLDAYILVCTIKAVLTADGAY
jgi:Undecaprenyl-phosphate galactose phosphotransferase WbaP